MPRDCTHVPARGASSAGCWQQGGGTMCIVYLPPDRMDQRPGVWHARGGDHGCSAWCGYMWWVASGRCSTGAHWVRRSSRSAMRAMVPSPSQQMQGPQEHRCLIFAPCVCESELMSFRFQSLECAVLCIVIFKLHSSSLQRLCASISYPLAFHRGPRVHRA